MIMYEFQVFNRLWGVTLDTGTSPLTPVDLLVALHLIDNEKCDVKTVIKGKIICSDRILTCRIKSICSPAKGGTGCYRFNYQPGS